MRLFEFDARIGDWRVLVQSRDIRNGAIQSFHIAPGAITADKVGSGAVRSEHIAPGAITADKIQPEAVGREHLAPEAINNLERAMLQSLDFIGGEAARQIVQQAIGIE